MAAISMKQQSRVKQAGSGIRIEAGAKLAGPSLDPVESARLARLRYVNDARPGIRRKRAGSGFRYIGVDGKPIHDPAILDRIRSLAIPPAYRDVWICPDPNGHIQATARDARGRKQYRYHPRWRQIRDETKYDRMVAFGEALPQIRRRVSEDLEKPGLPREKVLAAIVRLLETTMIRVGNKEYAEKNGHFGLTTMENRHVDVEGSTIHFRFRGKSGKIHQIDLRDARIARLVKRCQHLPGQELFEYLDEGGQLRTVDSGDVNDYLQEIAGGDFTAKDFRTWAGTLLAALALREFEAFDSEAQAKRNVVKAIESVARQLGNTPSICRKCYVHPGIIETYVSGTMSDMLNQRIGKALSQSLHELEPEEAAVLALLRERLQSE